MGPDPASSHSSPPTTRTQLRCPEGPEPLRFQSGSCTMAAWQPILPSGMSSTSWRSFSASTAMAAEGSTASTAMASAASPSGADISSSSEELPELDTGPAELEEEPPLAEMGQMKTSTDACEGAPPATKNALPPPMAATAAEVLGMVRRVSNRDQLWVAALKISMVACVSARPKTSSQPPTAAMARDPKLTTLDPDRGTRIGAQSVHLFASGS